MIVMWRLAVPPSRELLRQLEAIETWIQHVQESEADAFWVSPGE